MGKTENNRTIKLLALDVDGTLFDEKSARRLLMQ